MVKIDVVVKNETGIHARPATTLVQKASKFTSEIKLEFNGKDANLKSLIGVLSLAVTKDSNVAVIAEGEDEKLAANTIAEFLRDLQE